MKTTLLGQFGMLLSALSCSLGADSAELRKLHDLVIYEDPRFYAAFPSMVKRADGELLVAFRRAPERRVLGEGRVTHTDPNSYLVLVRSKDNGRTWSKEPKLIYAHPFGGSQDPCMVQLRDGTILCTSYGWALLKADAIQEAAATRVACGRFRFSRRLHPALQRWRSHVARAGDPATVPGRSEP